MEKTLDQMPCGTRMRIAAIDWPCLSADEGRRLRELGLVDGIEVEMLHRGTLFSQDPLAIGIGRMRIAIRSRHAAAVHVVAIDGSGT